MTLGVPSITVVLSRTEGKKRVTQIAPSIVDFLPFRLSAVIVFFRSLPGVPLAPEGKSKRKTAPSISPTTFAKRNDQFDAVSLEICILCGCCTGKAKGNCRSRARGLE
jgi:hypothetical protein